jgi:hypothetical protein
MLVITTPRRVGIRILSVILFTRYKT